MQLSSDCQNLLIFNKKPIEFQKYILENDPELLEIARKDHEKDREKKRLKIIDDEREGLENEDNLKEQEEFVIS